MRSALVLAFVAVAVPAAAEPYVMIRSSKAPQTKIHKAEIKAIYLGKTKTWNDGPALVVIRGEDDPVFGSFAEDVFAVAARLLLGKIKQEVFKGELAKPLKAGDDDEAIKLVKTNPTAIGVIGVASARSLPAGVAVLEVLP